MLPPECSDSTRSGAERKVFTWIEQDLGNEWVGLHSVGEINHPTKPWAEIDFVIIGPAGIFCIEVKGGRITRRDGVWYFIDRDDNVATKTEGPFQQVASAAAALRAFLVTRDPELRAAVVGHGVATPDIAFEASGPDIEPRIIYDQRDTVRPFTAYVRRLSDYWHERVEQMTRRGVGMLNQRQRQLAVSAIRGDFDLRPSLAARADRINQDLLELTKQQYQVLDGLRENERTLIRGCAGSGKTWLGVEEARRHGRAGKSVLLCCRTPLLADFLQRSVHDLAAVTCVDLRSFMLNLVAEANLKDRLPKAEEADLFAVFLPELTVDALVSLDRYRAYDVLIVDEAQDLFLLPFVELFDALVKGGLAHGRWMIFADAYQDVFESTSADGLRPLSDVQPAQYRLTVNCRNTKPVAVAAQILSGTDWTETLHTSGPDVEHYFYTSESEQRRQVSKCILRWLGNNVKPENIVVLSNEGLRQSSFRDGLIDVPYPLVDGNSHASGSNEIRFFRIADFKGMESDIVALVDVDNLTDRAALLSAYVGATRPRVGLAVFMDVAIKPVYEAKAFDYGARFDKSKG